MPQIVKNYFILLMLLTSNVWSYEPDTRNVEQALIEGNFSFIGRVVKIEEIKHSMASSKANTTFQVILPLNGNNIINNQLITLTHFSRAYIEYPNPIFGVSFSVSKEYLVITDGNFNTELKTYQFRSNAGRADIAYEVKNKKGDPFFDEKSKSHYYSTVYGLGYHGSIPLNNVIKWAQLGR